jgi:phage terminase large subunit GpA-like protein
MVTTDIERIIKPNSKKIAPPERMSASEWADRKFYLSPEASAEHGKYHLDRTPFHAGIVDAPFTEGIRETWVMASAQWGKTSCGLIILGYMAEVKPIPLLWVAPTLQMAESTSTDRIAPMFRDSPSLRPLLKSARSRDSGNRILHKELTNGMIIDLAGSNSESSLASRPKGAIIFDEMDKYDIEAGAGGDPAAQAIKRTITFGDRAIIIGVSTPGVKDKSRIEKNFLASDQRYYHVPCPHCDSKIDLIWENLTYTGKGTDTFDLSDLYYFCQVCGAAIPEKAKPDIMPKGEWIKRNPDVKHIAGFHIWEAYSPWVKWADICLNYQAAYKDYMTLRAFTQLSLGLPAEEDNRTKFDWELLLKRAETSDYSSGQIPEGVLLLTAGVDRQRDRLECSVFGWGEGEESWLICHEQFWGDPLEDTVWKNLDDFLKKQYNHPLGGKIAVTKTMVDTGFETHDTYRQIKRRANWIAIKGREGDREIVPSATIVGVNYQGIREKAGIRLYVIGVDRAKATLLSRCRIEDKGPKFFNVPSDLSSFWAEGFAGSELMLRKYKNGNPYIVWERIQSIHNEPLDCTVYSFAAAILCGFHRDSFNWERLRRLMTVEEAETVEETPSSEPPPVIKKVPKKHFAMSRNNSKFDY